MTKSEAVKIFGGSQVRLAEALGLHVQTIRQWGENIPRRHDQAIKNAIAVEALRLQKQAEDLRNVAGV